MDEVEVVVAHGERATLRVGEVFVKVDGHPTRLATEVRAMDLAPAPTPAVLWHEPPALALTAVPGTALGVLGVPSEASSAAWAAAGRAIRRLHEAPLPPWPGRPLADVEAELERECEWLLAHSPLPAEVVQCNREIARGALRPWRPAFLHGDLQITHVFVEDDEVTGIIDWSEGAPGDAMFDLAILTLGHEERLEDLLAGFGTDVDRGAIRAWWSLRSLTAARWLLEHGFDPDAPGCEFDVLRARMREGSRVIHRVCVGALVGPRGVLLAHRSPHRRHYPECWDFPGGHVEPGESASAALRRELREEIGVEVEVSGDPRLLIETSEADGGLDLRLWVFTTWEGEPRNLAPEEHDDLRWITREELPTLRLAHPSYATLLEDLLAPTDDPVPPRESAAHSTLGARSLDH